MVKKVLIGILIVVLLAGAAGGGYFAYQHFKGKKAGDAGAGFNTYIKIDGTVLSVDVGEDIINHFTSNNVISNLTESSTSSDYNWDADFNLSVTTSLEPTDIYKDGKAEIITKKDFELTEITGLDMANIYENNLSDSNIEKIKTFVTSKNLKGLINIYDNTTLEVYSFQDYVKIDGTVLSFDIQDMVVNGYFEVDRTLIVMMLVEDGAVKFANGKNSLYEVREYNFKAVK